MKEGWGSSSTAKTAGHHSFFFQTEINHVLVRDYFQLWIDTHLVLSKVFTAAEWSVALTQIKTTLPMFINMPPTATDVFLIVYGRQ